MKLYYSDGNQFSTNFSLSSVICFQNEMIFYSIQPERFEINLGQFMMPEIIISHCLISIKVMLVINFIAKSG
jgi:hypothetical protein